MEKSPAIDVPFEVVDALKVDGYFDPVAAFRTQTLVTSDDRRFRLDVDPYLGEADEALQHFAHYHMNGNIPQLIDEVNVVILKGMNDYTIRLENGNLLISKNGELTSYPWATMEYYRIDRPAQNLNLKFPEKKMFVSLSGPNVTNLWLVLQLLDRFATQQGLLK